MVPNCCDVPVSLLKTCCVNVVIGCCKDLVPFGRNHEINIDKGDSIFNVPKPILIAIFVLVSLCVLAFIRCIYVCCTARNTKTKYKKITNKSNETSNTDVTTDVTTDV